MVESQILECFARNNGCVKTPAFCIFSQLYGGQFRIYKDFGKLFFVAAFANTRKFI